MIKRFHICDATGLYMGWTDAKTKEEALSKFEGRSAQLFPKPWRASTNGKPTKWQPK